MIKLEDDLPGPYVHWTSELKQFLSQEENLLVLDDKMGLFRALTLVWYIIIYKPLQCH